MDDSVTVTLSGRALELAQRAVERGYCDSVADAVDRGLQCMSAMDLEAEELDDRWSAEFTKELRASLQEAIVALRDGVPKADSPEYWEHLRLGAIARATQAMPSRAS
ncbi:MAG: hypothetical protein ACKVT1_16035 [Dehalococcoidia bacterium]